MIAHPSTAVSAQAATWLVDGAVADHRSRGGVGLGNTGVFG